MTNATVAAAKLEFDVMGTQAGIMYPEYMLLAVPLIVFFALYLRPGGFSRKKATFLAVRLLVILLVCAALASPLYYRTHKEVQETHPITVLVDATPSMRLYPDASKTGYMVYDKIRSAVGNLSGNAQNNIKIEYVQDGNRTGLGDAIYQSMVQYGGEPMTMVVVSDGRNNYGRNPVDMSKVLSETNSTLYSIKPSKQADDVYIAAVVGDKKIPSGSKYDLLVRVGNTGYSDVSYELNLYVDNIRKFNQEFSQSEPLKDIPFSLNIREIGVHEVKVELTSRKSTFPENDVYFKTVEVVEKPKLLLVSVNSTSPMLQILDKLYAVEPTRNVDNDYSKYAATVFDNINAAELDRNQATKIRKYVMEGNGVAFVGGKNSFEYGGYNNSFIENILPVKSTDKPVERRRELAVVFLIDISESTEYGVGADSKIDVEKAVALKMLGALNANDTVGVYAFNTMPYVVSPMSQLGPKFDDTWQRIRELKFGGGTEMQPALDAAEATLKDYSVDKYLIVISDGVIRSTRMQLALDSAGRMKDEGIHTFTVGVGFDTDENFMQSLSQSGGGQYFSLKSNPDTRLKVVFGDQEDDKTKDTTPVVVSDEYHYITRNLPELNDKGSSVKGYNKVYEKTVAQMLISTKGGKPVLTVWNFGLGRVAALTTDNGLMWGQSLMEVDSGRVVSAMTNWIIGDLEKGKKVRISSQDSTLGAPVAFQVASSGQPAVEVKNTATLDSPQVVLTRTGLASFSGSFNPKDSGFYGIKATLGQNQDLDAVAVNYAREYSSLGVDDDTLRRMAASTGSRLYTEAEADALVSDLLARVKETSTQEIRDPQELWQLIAAAALALYFIDTVVRRILAIFRKTDEAAPSEEKPRGRLGKPGADRLSRRR